MLRSVKKKIHEILRVTSEVATQREHFSKTLQISQKARSSRRKC